MRQLWDKVEEAEGKGNICLVRRSQRGERPWDVCFVRNTTKISVVDASGAATQNSWEVSSGEWKGRGGGDGGIGLSREREIRSET